jgi:Ni/Co efflux regulator RcnB
MSLVLLVVFLVLSAVAAVSAEPAGRAQRRRADRREKQAQRRDADHDRAAARKREEDEHRRREREREEARLASIPGFRARFETLRARYREALAPFEAVVAQATATIARLTQLADDIRNALPANRDPVWSTVAAVLIGAIWITAFSVEVAIDARSLAGLDYPRLMAILLALLASLSFSLIGLMLSDALGLTRLFPFMRDMRRFTRRIVVIDAIVVLCAGLSLLPRVMEYRSAPLAAKVSTLEQNQRLLEDAPVEDKVKANAAQKLAAAQEKLDTAHYADQRLGISAAALEALTSWGGVWLLLIVTDAGLLAGVGRAKRRQRRAKTQITAHERGFQTEIAALAERSGITPEQLKSMLEGPEAPPPDPDPEPDPVPEPEPQAPPHKLEPDPAHEPKPKPERQSPASHDPSDDSDQPPPDGWRAAF